MPSRRIGSLGLLLVLVLAGDTLLASACGGSDETPASSAGAGGSASTTSTSQATGAGGGTGGGASTGAGGGETCDAFGRFGTPTSTLTLTATDDGQGGKVIDYGDVQKSFPDVDWSTLDRLYLPAGSYHHLRIGNLPERDPAHPLVITNEGGQVRVGDDPQGNFIWSMTGGSGWVLTGRYDPESQTGDEGFQGHRCGHYASSAGSYGILSDDAFALSAPYLHMGIAVTDATDFEIEYVEVRRSGFAGIRLLNPRAAGDPPKPMANVRVHDVYVHDTAGEGFYFGWTGDPPSNSFPGLDIHDVRILRTGNEALQIQDLGDGAHVHHNVFANGGMHWLDNGLGRYQDNDSQITTREGTIEIDHDLFIDGAESLASFWSAPEAGDGDRHVTFHDDYFADTLDLGVYFGGSAAAGSTFTFAKSFFRGLAFGFQIVDPNATEPAVFGVGGDIQAPVALTDDTWEGARDLFPGLVGGNGTKGSVTGTGNVNGSVAAVAFVAPGYPIDAPGHHLTYWAPVATVNPAKPTVTYAVGDVVSYGDAPDFYRCTQATSAGPPPDHPEAWEKLPAPTDDVRVAPASPYAGMGVR